MAELRGMSENLHRLYEIVTESAETNPELMRARAESAERVAVFRRQADARSRAEAAAPVAPGAQRKRGERRGK
jgi:hypothetical protein